MRKPCPRCKNDETTWTTYRCTNGKEHVEKREKGIIIFCTVCAGGTSKQSFGGGKCICPVCDKYASSYGKTGPEA